MRMTDLPMVVNSPGAMRELCRLEDQAGDLNLESPRCVAKRYTMASVQHLRRNAGVGDEVYFRDVHMQFVAKTWADHFNQQNPPKRIEMIPAVVLERKDPETLSSEYFAVERYIGEGFEKFNSNHFTPQLLMSQTSRETPDAFSHFTYDASGGRLLVADIQGVGDVYTDPQILTPEDKQFEFGVGNTAEEGIKLWFASHQCRSLCHHLQLQHPFPDELKDGLTHVKNMNQLHLLFTRNHGATTGLNTASTATGLKELAADASHTNATSEDAAADREGEKKMEKGVKEPGAKR